MLNETRIRSFLALAEGLNYSRTAEALYLSQQALSAQISALEKDVGLPLFRRTTRSVELTEAGRELYELFKKTAQEYAGIREKYCAASAGPRLLRIGYFEDMDISMQLFEAKARLPARYGEIACQLILKTNYRGILEGLDGGDFELAILPGGIDPSPARYQVRWFLNKELFLFVSPRFPGAREGMGIGDLRSAAFFVGSEPNLGRTVLESACAAHGFVPRYDEGRASPSVERMMIEAGEGVGMGGRFSLLHRNRELIRIPLNMADASIMALWRKDFSDHLVRTYVDTLENLLC